jgi:hypothetical protein
MKRLEKLRLILRKIQWLVYLGDKVYRLDKKIKNFTYHQSNLRIEQQKLK